MNRIAAFLIVTLALSGCASVMGHSTQEVTFLTPGAHDSVCIIDNGETLYKAYPPQRINLSKRSGDLKVRCIADGNRERTIEIPQESSSLSLANASNGFIPGLLVDSQTGALYEYPDTISVDFTNIPSRPMERPNYDKHIDENPDLYGMEEFHPGRAALIRDKYTVKHDLKKRPLPGSEGGDMTIEETSKPALEKTSSEGPAKTNEGNPKDDLVSDLTRKMNPQIFGGQDGQDSGSSGSSDGGFVGGTSGTSDNNPVSLYPTPKQ